MATVDLKDAYYSVKIYENDTFLKFLCDGKLFKFIILLNGILPGPSKFTNFSKPPFAFLRLRSPTIAISIDDLFTTENYIEDC